MTVVSAFLVVNFISLLEGIYLESPKSVSFKWP